jgi:chemotaxis protein methyltransferase CheR
MDARLKASNMDAPGIINGNRMPSEKTVEIIENVFAKFAGFKKSEPLRKKITRVIEGKSDIEIMEWINYMMTSHGDAELFTLAEDLTNHETFFFRDIIQLQCFEYEILPAIIKQKKKDNDRVIRIWSGACSTGEEAYSLAMIACKFMEANNLATISESGQVFFKDNWNLKIYGTDISRQVVAIARNGIYSDAGLSPFRSFPPQYYRFFDFLGKNEDRLYHQNSKNYGVKKGIKDLTTFECHNLNSKDLPLMLKGMDVIFLRNTMIYLDADSQAQILKKFHTALSKKAYLVLSVVDRMHVPELYSEVRLDKNIVYRKS